MSGSKSFPQSSGFLGSANYYSGGSLFNAISFMTRQIMAGKAFAGLVEVVAVTGGGPSGLPMVAVKPLVDQVDGFGNRTPHGTIYNIPAFRYQAGAVAFIADPMVGDIGQAVICDRDTSTVKATQKQSGPGSARQNDWADGMYYGAFHDKAPTTFISAGPTGVSIKSPLAITIDTQNVQLDSSGNLKVKGEITAKDGASFVDMTHHTHTNVQVGGGLSGPPQPGT